MNTSTPACCVCGKGTSTTATQTFGRFVHFWIHYNNSSGPEGRRADAKDNFDTVRPFAVLDYRAANAAAYLQAMAERGVSNFLPSGTYTVGGQPSEYLRKYPGLVWGYDPTVEIRARNFSSYVCSQVVPFNTSFSGNTDELGRTENGKPRRLGLLWTTDSFSPQLKAYADIVRREVSACGGNFVADESFPDWCFDISCRGVDPTPAQLIVAEFQREKVSTIIWTGGPNNNISNAAGRIGYFPEVIIGGDNAIDATFEGQWHDKNFWSRAYAVSTYVKQNPFEDTPCMLAAFEADPRAPRQDVRDFGCKFFDAFRQLFTGIQVAGPKLTPASMDRGFHAIPSISSSDPRVPACFYLSSDYTCAKDATAEWWDPSGDDPEQSGPGCWRLIQAGKRYLSGSWPKQDVPFYKRADDPCNPQGLAF